MESEDGVSAKASISLHDSDRGQIDKKILGFSFKKNHMRYVSPHENILTSRVSLSC